MSKLKRTGAAPVSKYAAKKNANAIANAMANAMEGISVQEESSDVTTSVEVTAPEKVASVSPQQAMKKSKKELPPVTGRYPEHIVQIALIIKNNAEIRRFTALGILNYLLQKGEIKGNSRYVSFKWNKFAVKCDGLMREYSYNEPFFLNALVASFASFSASAQHTIDHFCHQEMSIGIGKAVDSEEVDSIVALNEEYQKNDKGKDDIVIE